MSSVDRCGSLVRSRYFPSSLASAVIFAASVRSSPPGVTRRNRLSPGLVEITPRSSARFVGGEPVRAGDHRFEPVDQVGADCGVTGGGVGVVADHEPLRLTDLDFLYP